jgi:hypothetical protein
MGSLNLHPLDFMGYFDAFGQAVVRLWSVGPRSARTS